MHTHTHTHTHMDLTLCQSAVELVAAREAQVVALQDTLEKQIDVDIIAPLHKAVDAHREELVRVARKACSSRQERLAAQHVDLTRAVSTTEETLTNYLKAMEEENTVALVQVAAEQRARVDGLATEPCCWPDIELIGRVREFAWKSVWVSAWAFCLFEVCLFRDTQLCASELLTHQQRAR
jgi:DNA-binding phage protein